MSPDELRQFDAALASVARKRTGRLLLLRGEAGIGKTRLVEACVERARAAGFACHAALVLDFGVSRGRGAIAALVAGLLGAPAAAEADTRRAAPATSIAAGSVARDDEAFLLDLAELPLPAHLKSTYEAMEPGARSRGRQAALATLVARSAAEQPRLLVLEDLHWADCAHARRTVTINAEIAGTGHSRGGLQHPRSHRGASKSPRDESALR